MNKKSSREGVRCECGHCHIEFLVSKKVVRRALKGSGKGSYCSNQCRIAARKLKLVTAKCRLCSKEFIKQEGGSRKRVFCSRDCGNKFAGITRANQSELIKCRCGIAIKRCEKKSCSRKCSVRFIYEDFIRKWKNGEHPGHRNKYFTICNPVRKYIKDKYDNKCADCGWNKINPTTGNIPLHIHHIDGDVSNSTEDNLILLCPNCHSLTETFGSLNKSSKRNFRKQYYQPCD